MEKVFNTSAACMPDKHYMVDITEKLEQIKGMADKGQCFTINRADSTARPRHEKLWNGFCEMTILW